MAHVEAEMLQSCGDGKQFMHSNPPWSYRWDKGKSQENEDVEPRKCWLDNDDNIKVSQYLNASELYRICKVEKTSAVVSGL